MASNRNEVTIEGNLTRDPELRSTPGGISVCKFSIASNRFRKVGEEFEKETSFFDIECWRELADHTYSTVQKGTPVEVKGRLKQDRWMVNGQNRSKVVIVAESVYIQQRKQYSNPQGNQTEGCPF